VKRPTFWWADIAALWRERDRELVAVRTSDAEALLLSLLPPGERDRYRENKEFVVAGSQGGVYLIRYGYIGNVYRLPDWQSFCAHPLLYGDTPLEFALIAQLLTISTNEDHFVAVANLPA